MIHPPLFYTWLKTRRSGPVADPVTALAWRLATAPRPLPATPADLAVRLWRSGASPADLVTAHRAAAEYAAYRLALLTEPAALAPTDAVATATSDH